MSGKTIVLLVLALLFGACSDNPSDSGKTDDTLPPETLDNAVLVFDSTAITFKRVPMPDSTKLWVSECEITANQFAVILDSAYTSSGNPKAMTWYQAALFANALSAKCNLGLDTLKTMPPPPGSDTIDPNFIFSPVYGVQQESLVTVSCPRILISPFICVLDTDTLVAAEVKQTVREAFSVSISACCTLRTLDADTLSLILSTRPDSIALPDTSLIIFPNEYLDGSVLAFRMDSLLDALPAALPAVFFKHEYSKPGTDTLLLAVFYGEVPPDSLRKGVFAAYPGVVLAHPDTLILRPDSLTFTVKVWPKNAASYGFRLPTEEEWEDIASCNMGLEYSTYSGKLAVESAVFNASSVVPAPGDRKPNPYGLYDFTGNLFEWTSDWWSADDVNSAYPHYFPTKVIKGGCFTSAPDDPALKITGRYSEHPDSLLRYGTTGRTGCRIVIEDTTFWNYRKR